MKRVRHAAPFLAVAALGALVLHQLVYLVLAGAGGLHLTGEHGHLSTQWAVLAPAAVLGAAALVLRQIKQLGYQLVSAGRLATASGVLFLCQESIESTLAGNSGLSFLLSPAALLSVALAPLVGWTLVAALTTVAEAVAGFVAAISPTLVGADPAPIATFLAVDTSVILGQSPARGPPRSFV